jgi:glutaminyl-peptide cyclotransferase
VADGPDCVIAPASGRVVAWLNLKGLMPGQATPDAVLNGIAYDAARDRLFVTGKLWPAHVRDPRHRR